MLTHILELYEILFLQSVFGFGTFYFFHFDD